MPAGIYWLGGRGSPSIRVQTTRRTLDFLSTLARLGAGSTLTALSIGRAVAQPAPSPLVRRNINNKEANADLEAYAVAVTRMKALPAADPWSWERQAAIHKDSCPHYNWWSLNTRVRW